jgi:hypothetical protein
MMRLIEDTTGETENALFTKQFVKISSDQNSQGPWEHQKPLKPRPKAFPVNDPDMKGG